MHDGNTAGSKSTKFDICVMFTQYAQDILH